MKELLYLSLDSLKEGVGSSQVLAYMRKVQPTMQVTILSLEKIMPSKAEVLELEREGIKWLPLPFGRFGVLGGISRVFRIWLRIDRSKIIHARSTLPALAAMLKFPKSWIWDCRSLQADQRKALSSNTKDYFIFKIMRAIEFVLAKRCESIIVITNAVVPVIMNRYKISRDKITVIPTCVDIAKFKVTPMNLGEEIKVLFAGTFSLAYDVPLINRIIRKLKEYTRVSVTIATSQGSTDNWKQVEYDSVVSVPHKDMPALIGEHHLGISLWRNDLGMSLTSVASTKTAEFLACGRPVLINSLQGDFGTLIRKYDAGVVTVSGSESEVDEYAKNVMKIIQDKSTPKRCRDLAVEVFDLNLGVGNLIQLYVKL